MTSPVATVGLTYAGVDLQESDLQVFLQIRTGLNETPAVRGSDTVVPGLAGRVEGNRVNDVLSIELVGFVRADPASVDRAAAKSSFRANILWLRTLFASNRARADLVATLEDGSTQSISARPLSMIWNESVQGEFSAVSIDLEGYDDWAVAGS